MVKGKLVILRHGETPYNKQGLMTGQRDVPPTPLGEDQARAAGKLLAAMAFDTAYSSTLSRAFNTAALVLGASGSNDHLNKPDGTWNIIQNADIIEGDVGDFSGRSYKTDPEILAWKKRGNSQFPNGENNAQVVARVQRFFETQIVPRLERGENVIVVCHAGVLRAFDTVLGVQCTTGTRGVPNASPSVFEYEDGKMTGFYQLQNPKDPDRDHPPPLGKGPKLAA